MADNEETKNLTPEEEGAAPEAEAPAEKPAEELKPAKEKKTRPSKEDKKELSRYKKEWEDSLVASKRVKREEARRKWRKAMLVLLVISLLTTSIVYIMLLFIEENNIRITASSTEDQAISLSFDKSHWTPYLDVDGPTEMQDVSYSMVYGDKHAEIPTLGEMEGIVEGLLVDSTTTGGDWSKPDVIEFSFYLRNECDQDVPVYYEMSLVCDDRGLENAIRVVWAESHDFNEPKTTVRCYASLSDDERLAFSTKDGNGKTHREGGVEYVAYPVGSDNADSWGVERFSQFFINNSEYNAINGDYYNYPVPESYTAGGATAAQALANYKSDLGYVPTVPFAGNDKVFTNESVIAEGDMLCVYVCVWIEGSDLDCVDSAIGGYVTLSINFAVV